MTVTDNDADIKSMNTRESMNTLSLTVTIAPNVTASELAAELRKIRDALNRAYRNALLEDKMPIYHPVMQGLAISAAQMEGAVQILDPPRVQPGTGMQGQFPGLPARGRA